MQFFILFMISILKEFGRGQITLPKKWRERFNTNVYIANIENLVGKMLSERAFYEVKYGHTDRAKIYLKKILNDLPGFPLHPALQNLLKD